MCDDYNNIKLYERNKNMLECFQCREQDNFYTECFEKNETIGEAYVTFAKLPTAEKKFLYVFDHLKKHNKLPTKCEPTNLKNNSEARKIRIDANEIFKKKDYVTALCKYNKSVMTAKINSQDYAFALANRSAALYYLEEYKACISDIHRSLAAKYPNELAYKLYEREINCLERMGNLSEAEFKYKKFLSYLTEAVLPNEKKKNIEMNIGILLKKSSKEMKSNIDDKKYVIKLLGGSNKNIPTLSKYIKMKYSESMGRCLVASIDLNPGDILAIEKPYAGVLLCGMPLEHNCRYCFNRCIGGLPCYNCTSVIYCDEICRQKSYDSGHKYECTMLTELNDWIGIEHMEQLSLYILLTNVCKIGLTKYIESILELKADTTDPIMRGFNSNGKYLSDHFCTVYTLEGNETKRKVNDLFIRNCYAAVMVSFMTLVGLKIPDHQLGIVGESLVHIMCVVSSNAHEITQYTVRKTWSLPKKCLEVASLLMPVLSLLNHHCDPNVIRHNYNGTIVLRALQPISKNSQLYDNYGKVYGTHTKHFRQLMLNTQYLFHCECEPCKENWPTYDILSNQPQSNCIMLSKNTSSMFKKQSRQLHKIIAYLTDNDCHDGLQYMDFLYSYLSFLHKNVKKPWKEYCNCQETLKEILCKSIDKFIIEDS